MLNTVSQQLTGLSSPSNNGVLSPLFYALADRCSSQTINSAALRIKGGSASAIVQTNAVSLYLAKGRLVSKATALDMPALVGTVANATFNLFAFFGNQAGTISVAMGLAGTTLAKVTFPAIPEGSAVIGFIIINPTGAGNFVGGTTVLDDATVIPNVVFANTLSAFDPTILI